MITAEAKGPQVSVIPATKRSVQGGAQLKKQTNIRVAAYCRVSTGDESQLTSYTNQKAFYAGLIQNREGWRFAGIYADEAISGTSRAHRDAFNRMMEDARNGRLDYIVTKSISRFARNTVDTLNCVRELRQQNPPVGVYFEKENVDTLDATGELILTILSALAQDESRSISENIRWTFRKNFQAGIPQINLKRMIGYDKAEDGTWVINPEQAATVQYIFDRYVCGRSANRIAEELNKLGRKTINDKNWSCSSVMTVLRNEKYVGDLEMQKTVTRDFLTHRSTINHGEAPKYYVKNHHAAIIDRTTWDKVQAMLRKKSGENTECIADEKRQTGPGKSPFFNLRCKAALSGTEEECGGKLIRMTYTGTASGYTDERSLAATGGDTSRYLEKYVYAYPVWKCERRAGERKGKISGIHSEKKDRNCPSEILHECAIEQSFMEMLYALKRDYEANGNSSRICTLFQEAYESACQRERGNHISAVRMEILDDQIAELENKLRRMTDRQSDAAWEKAPGMNKEPGKIQEERAETEENLRQQLYELQQQKNALASGQGTTTVMQKNFDFFLKCLKELPEVNRAGMRIMVDGLDVQGSFLRNIDGTAKTGARKNARGGQRNLPLEKMMAAPDFLPFERGIYMAFILSGTIRGDCIEYTTNFGVKLMTTGNRRTLGSFLGFKKCRDDGSVEILDVPYKVCGNSIQYRRYLRKGEKKEKKEI
ncbi:resolvase, N-terminal domain protein [Marvinbryantia formatexigens DSM 14469]|uniref:Resolvase, N-terminal domain protein n=1 Tax=Marvinbryantia formatexigens DSM 14469 TaxID=478749 RepID=C6LGB1_9FIRM|nr:recombinase family protein [Marvinbryantia formatexigens]EET60475.1 resolvase, N-terminal domain protein [Marvinbryantia formatexigens DSM 14469]UWO25193.1 recombinase family protein [Marvinbryantia formatexigens DSM 14469]SDH08024.1 Site-specific DNA recombinase [Marvinbryantia formatexigens]